MAMYALVPSSGVKKKTISIKQSVIDSSGSVIIKRGNISYKPLALFPLVEDKCLSTIKCIFCEQFIFALLNVGTSNLSFRSLWPAPLVVLRLGQTIEHCWTGSPTFFSKDIQHCWTGGKTLSNII